LSTPRWPLRDAIRLLKKGAVMRMDQAAECSSLGGAYRYDENDKLLIYVPRRGPHVLVQTEDVNGDLLFEICPISDADRASEDWKPNEEKDVVH
jgi:hypothetical protein